MSGVRLDEPVFPYTLGGLRDPNGVHRDIGRFVGATAWLGSPPTTWQDNGTILDEASSSARPVADPLGHARVSITQDVYLGGAARHRPSRGGPGGALNDSPNDESVTGRTRQAADMPTDLRRWLPRLDSNQ
jgi:hypothetical protein